MKLLGVYLVCVLFVVDQGLAWGGGSQHGKVKLKDIEVLTLYDGRMTSGRRSSPVSQLTCIGGTAAHQFKPQVVQCYNRGYDGQDVQWECKTDMDNAYRFGRIQVTCEGYDYPDDPYILKGSCGMEYTLDLTKEGYQQKDSGHHNYYGNEKTIYTDTYAKKGGSEAGNVIILVVACIVIYAIYKTCLSNQNRSSSDGNGPDSSRPSWFGGGGGYPSAPPPGFRSEYTQDAGCGAESRSSGSSSSGSGFWRGAATGGLLGYMFGSRNNQSYGSRPAYSTHRSFGGVGETTYRSSSGGSSSSSSGTRTASGFGGTSRR